MSLNILSSNLQRLRHAHGLSQDKLALAAGISRIAYLNIERRQAEPRAETLRALAKALHVRVPELLVEAPVLKRVRFRSLKRLKRREQVLIEVGQKLRDFTELETQLKASDHKDFDALRAVATRPVGRASLLWLRPCGLTLVWVSMSPCTISAAS